jgi:hypothetical protein
MEIEWCTRDFASAIRLSGVRSKPLDRNASHATVLSPEMFVLPAYELYFGRC